MPFPRRSALVALLLCAAAAAHAQPAPSMPIDPARARAELGQLGLVEQIVLPRPDGPRDVRLYLSHPPGPAPAQGWPVLYLLDGNATVAALARERPELARQVVLAGIGYDVPGRLDVDARAWDYTPAPPDAARQGSADPLRAQRRNGGADAWLDFIETRIKPLVQSRVPVDAARQTLYGHSYGGLFVLHALQARPEAFQRYVAASPSLWWHAPYVTERMQALDTARCCADRPVRLTLMAGGAERGRPGSPQQRAMPSGGARALAQALAGRLGLVVNYVEMAGLGHGAMLPASAVEAARLAGRP